MLLARMRGDAPAAAQLAVMAPTLMAREKAHFVRVDSGEWDALMSELDREEANHG